MSNSPDVYATRRSSNCCGSESARGPVCSHAPLPALFISALISL